MKTPYDYQPFWNSWTILREIGSGGIGTVYEVTNGTDHNALKFIHIEFPPEVQSTPEDIKQYLKEAVEEIILTVTLDQNPTLKNVVSYFDVGSEIGETSADVWIRMELLEPLTERIKKQGLTLSDVKKIGVDICEAVSSIHTRGMIHRDIKISNILCDGDNYKLGDFDTVIKKADIDKKGMAGSIHTMAPEILRGEMYGTSSDLYSLGMTLYLLLNDFKSPSPEQRMNGVSLPKAKHASLMINSVIMKACAFKPGDRYSSADEMLVSLRKCRGSSKVVLNASEEVPEEDTSIRPDFVFGEHSDRVNNVTMRIDSVPKKAMHSNRNLFNWFFFTFVVSLVPMTIYLLCTWFIVNAATERTVFTHEFIFFSIVLLTSLMKTVLFGNIKRVYRLRALGIGIVSALVLIVAFGLFALIIVSETTTIQLVPNLDLVSKILCGLSVMLGGFTEHLEDKAAW